MSWPRITRNACEDAEGATRKFNLIRPSLGVDFTEALAAAFDVIGENPTQHARLETNRTKREVRRVILRPFRYLVIYEMIGDVPLVVAVRHASQDPNSWQRQDSSD